MTRHGAVGRFASGMVAVLLIVGGAAIALDRVAESRRSTDGAEWAYEPGGFEVSFPPPWRPASAGDETWAAARGPVLSASTHRRPTEGLLRTRHLSARVYALGEVPMDTPTLTVAAAVGRRIAGPHYALGGSSQAASGAFLTAYRFERSGVPVTQVLIVFRGRYSNGFIIEITGHRDDESVLLRDAEWIADSLRQDGRPLTDQERFLFDYLDVSYEAAEQVRHLTPALAIDSVSGSRLLVTAAVDATTPEVCRAAAVPVWLQTLGAFVRQRHPRGLWSHEIRMTCPASSVRIVYDIRGREYELTQFDVNGGPLLWQELPDLVYSKALSQVVYRADMGGNSIR